MESNKYVKYLLLILFIIFNRNVDIPIIHLPYSTNEGRSIYKKNCARCHGINKQGSMAPSLINIHGKKILYIVDMIKSGPGNMPTFNLNKQELANLIGYLIVREDKLSQ